MSFRDDFVWGCAAASYQIEGAWEADGKGPSVWDMAVRKPGFVYEGHTGDVACDHYHRAADDVKLMQGLGMQAYRLSISWPRVMPAGTGDVNEPGLAFYDTLIDQLLAANITPWVTLFHWDFPLALYRKGGWLNRDSVQWFADYTRVVVERLSDRVTHWMTLNEPQCFIGLGLQSGAHAPGGKLQLREVLLAGHHSLMAHGRACQVIREHAKKPPQIGYAPVGVVSYPATDNPADIDAARAAMFAPHGTGHMFTNTLWSDPVILGGYPQDVINNWGKDFPKVSDADLDLIHQPADFYGVNIYHGGPTRAAEKADAVTHGPAATGNAMTSFPPGFRKTHMNWPVSEEALYWGPTFFAQRYKLPVVVTENGMANLDWIHLDGKCHDPQRIDYLARYLGQLKRAAKDGVDVRGYFQWSIMDNFEWAEGYKQRFGLVHVDYQTQVRTPKDSAHWYAQVIKTNGANL